MDSDWALTHPDFADSHGVQEGSIHDAVVADGTSTSADFTEIDEPLAHESSDHLWMRDGDRIWDLGPADTDTDADGVADSLTRIGPDGMSVYTDANHDGQIDAITEVFNDGKYESRALDADSGTWVRTDIGRLQ